MILKQGVYHFCISALLYWVVETYAGAVFVIPEKIVSLAAFIPPMLGLMWGPAAAFGVYAGSLFVLPDFYWLISPDSSAIDRIFYVVRDFQVLLAGYLPCFLWRNRIFDANRQAPALKLYTLQKFLIIMVVTFAATAIFRGCTATAADFEWLVHSLGSRRVAIMPTYTFVCFINDFCLAIFIDLIWFFALISKGYEFYQLDGAAKGQSEAKDDLPEGEEYKAVITALKCYLIFPAVFAYLDIRQIYGMEDMRTWMGFVLECLLMMDLYLMLMLYLLLSYRRSIMMEVVFLVSQTVFLTATVLGWGSSLALTDLVKARADGRLHAMSGCAR